MHDSQPPKSEALTDVEGDDLSTSPGLDAIADHIASVSRNLDLLRAELAAQVKDAARREDALTQAGADLEHQREEHARAVADLDARRAGAQRLREELESAKTNIDGQERDIEARTQLLDAQEAAVEIAHESVLGREHAAQAKERKLEEALEQLETDEKWVSGLWCEIEGRDLVLLRDEAECWERLEAVGRREKSAIELECYLDKRERELDSRTSEAVASEERLRQCERELEQRETSIEQDLVRLAQRERALKEEAASVEKGRAALDETRSEMEAREASSIELAAKLAERDKALEFEERAAHELHERMRAREESFVEIERDLESRDAKIQSLESKAEAYERDLAERVTAVEVEEDRLTVEAAQLESRERAVELRETECDRSLENGWKNYQVACEKLTAREEALVAREDAFENVREVLRRMATAMAEPTRNHIEEVSDPNLLAAATSAFVAEEVKQADNEQDAPDPMQGDADPSDDSVEDDGADTVGCQSEVVESRSLTSDTSEDVVVEEPNGENEEDAYAGVGFASPEEQQRQATEQERSDSCASGSQDDPAHSDESLDVSDLTATELQKFRRLVRMSTDSEAELLRHIREEREKPVLPTRRGMWTLRRRTRSEGADRRPLELQKS